MQEYLGYPSTHPNGEKIRYRTSFEIFFNISVTSYLVKRNITAIQEDRHSGIDVEGTP